MFPYWNPKLEYKMACKPVNFLFSVFSYLDNENVYENEWLISKCWVCQRNAGTVWLKLALLWSVDVKLLRLLRRFLLTVLTWRLQIQASDNILSEIVVCSNWNYFGRTYFICENSRYQVYLYFLQFLWFWTRLIYQVYLNQSTYYTTLLFWGVGSYLHKIGRNIYFHMPAMCLCRDCNAC